MNLREARIYVSSHNKHNIVVLQIIHGNIKGCRGLDESGFYISTAFLTFTESAIFIDIYLPVLHCRHTRCQN